MSSIYLGIDVGSTTTKLVVVDEDGNLLDGHYRRSRGQPRQTLLQASRTIPAQYPGARVRGAGLTGSGGGPIAELVGGRHVNELVAQSRAVGAFHRTAKTVIEIGGQDSKLLSVDWDESSQQMVLLDFSMNTLCAAGTGSFLDQQAERLGLSIEDDFARIALASQNPARVAGRCTVFAKSDMIHLQQQGTPLSDILAGLCLALARNFRSVIGKGKSFTPPILFQGGVAFNAAVLRAFESVLDLQPGELIVPEHHCFMAALGAAYTVMDEEREGQTYAFHGFAPLRTSLAARRDEQHLPRLAACRVGEEENLRPVYAGRNGTAEVYLGADVGSVSTCLVLLDHDGRLVAHRYLPTAGTPLETVHRGLTELESEIGPHVKVRGVGATGSGRYLTGHFIGADVVRNEITAQARAAAAFDPDVDTVIEIGGQDSKFIRMHRGAVVDFAMNNACAAGTGSFLEEQADRLGISIEEEFARQALQAPAPVGLGERCTVFMESDLIHHQQCGASVENLTAGVAYSIAYNYLNRVVNGREVGSHILFQGGVASNESVRAAFEQVLGQPVTVPPHHRITGAVGAALLAREEMQRREGGARSAFRGFDLEHASYQSSVFICRACANLCEIKKVSIDGQAPIYYGARCDKFEEAGRSKAKRHRGLPDLFAEREQYLLGGYVEPRSRTEGRLRVGVPRALIFHDVFPFWHAFFEALDLDVVLSAPTNAQTVTDAHTHALVECCFPVRVMYGHVTELKGQDLDFIFLPSILDRENGAPGQQASNYCPLIPAAGQMVSAHLALAEAGIRPLVFPIHLSARRALKAGIKELAGQLGISARAAMRAADVGAATQRAFYQRIRRRGAEVLQTLTPGQPAVVLVGRPYNTADPGLCLDLPLKLRKMGVLPIPLDFLPLGSVDITDRHPDMYWRSGQDILAAARLIRQDDRLQAIYLTSFDCGPDSFLVSFFRRMMDPKPFLELEVDDHTAEAGIVTRCEAFLDSLNLTTGTRP